MSDEPAPKTSEQPAPDKPAESGGFIGDLSEKRGYTPAQPAPKNPPGGSNPPARKSDE